MDRNQFDTIARALAGEASRRRLLGRLIGATTGGALAMFGGRALAHQPNTSNMPPHRGPGEQRPCGRDVGACVPGVETCLSDSIWGPCEGGVGPQPETCNGVDDDCDGVVDEDFDLQTDPQNRGVCGHVCESNDCVDGRCQTPESDCVFSDVCDETCCDGKQCFSRETDGVQCGVPIVTQTTISEFVCVAGACTETTRPL